jgi:CRISPR/Cas system CSM-associated protein Csm3 (group 7 of RAMP superfamily)
VAEDKKKYDYELVERGAEGDFRAEITLRGYHKEVLGDGLPTAVRRLAKGVAAGFRLGAMTAKGFGRVQVDGLVMDRYDFGNPVDAFAWLSEPRGKAADHEDDVKAEASDRPLTESNLIIDADFALVGSLLVKDADVPEDKKTDDKTAIHAIMKKSRNAYLIPGPSVKGALRHHAGRVLKNLGFQEPKKFLNGLMGLDDAALKAASKRKDEETLRQSRFFVDEVYIAQEAVESFAQTRNRIDRFTGGTIGGALFTTEAVWGKGGKPVHIHFEIRDAEAADVGLAMLLLKDLSLGRVPLGGEKSIGRGVLEGVHAKIWYKPKREENQNSEINVVIENGKPVEGGAGELQACVDALAEMAKGTEATA